MRLTYCVRMLLETCQQPVLSSLILTQHLGDLMAALAQLAYAPKPKPSTMTQHGQATQSARKAAGTTISEMAALSNKQTYSGSKDIHCQHGDTLDSTACSTELKNKENHQPAKQQHCSQNSGDFPRESHSSGDFPSECHPSGDHSSSQGHLAKERLVHSSQIKDNRNVTEDGVLSTRMEGDHITTPESAVGGAYMVTKETLLDFKAAEKLEWLLGRVYPPLVVRELLLLQGGPSQSPAAATRVKVRRCNEGKGGCRYCENFGDFTGLRMDLDLLFWWYHAWLYTGVLSFPLNFLSVNVQDLFKFHGICIHFHQPHRMGHGQHLNLKWIWMDVVRLSEEYKCNSKL